MCKLIRELLKNESVTAMSWRTAIYVQVQLSGYFAKPKTLDP